MNNIISSELEKMRNDPIMFFEKYIKIQHPSKGLIPFTLYPHQKSLVQSYNDNNLHMVHASRQIGITMTNSAFALHTALFNHGSKICITSHNMSMCFEILPIIQQMYESLPRIFEMGNINHSRNELNFPNGSNISVLAPNLKTQVSKNMDLFIVDNFSSLPAGVAETMFMKAVSFNDNIDNIDKVTKIIFTNTGSLNPKGSSAGSRMWVNALNNKFHTHEIDWRCMPCWDDEWKKHQISILGTAQFAAEFELGI